MRDSIANENNENNWYLQKQRKSRRARNRSISSEVRSHRFALFPCDLYVNVSLLSSHRCVEERNVEARVSRAEEDGTCRPRGRESRSSRHVKVDETHRFETNRRAITLTIDFEMHSVCCVSYDYSGNFIIAMCLRSAQRKQLPWCDRCIDECSRPVRDPTIATYCPTTLTTKRR